LPIEAERIVVNTGPLIALGRIEAFDLIGRLPLAFIIPKAVADEIATGVRAGHKVTVPTWAAIVSLRDEIVPLGQYLLDAGEAAVIQLAIEQGVKDVCIDEWRGRRAAAAVGLQVTGSLGLLGRAKRLGLIPAVFPWVEKLTNAGIHYHPELLRNFLLAMGE
jgi:Predicted nucleic acid-binding protein, contains PIN domain